MLDLGKGLLFLFLVTGLFLEGCHSKTPETGANGRIYYTCPMHSRIHEDKPGNCPICGMKLVKIETDPETVIPLDSALRYIEDPVTKTVVGNFKVISPGKINPGDTITAEGYTSFDERDGNRVACRVGGRIEKLFVKYANQPIHKGQPLMKLYSPELLSVQRNLLEAVRDKDDLIITALKENLYNLGIHPQQVQQVIQSGQPLVEETIYSPYAGISREITTTQNSGLAPGYGPMSDVVPGMGGSSSLKMEAGNGSSDNKSGGPELLRIQEGMYVDAGQTVFSVQNMDHIWVILNVFNQDIAEISQGDLVLLSDASDSGQMITGKVNFISPFQVGGERTTRVRVYLNRLPDNWRVGSLVRGQIVAKGNNQGWAVPASAVNFLGTGNVVWVQDLKYPHVFHSREVITGEQTGDQIKIISGLKEGDKIAEIGSFMVDSDSFTQ